ncbi:MAG: DMT family transporter [Dehalococcoidia bacterium]
MGEAAALIAAFTWSATSVAMARLTVSVTPVAMSALRLAIATLILPVVLLLSGEAGQLADAPPSAIIAMIGSGLLAYAIGDTLYISALKRLGIQRVFPITMALFILLTVIGGIIWLGEDFSWMQAVGGVAVGAGIFLIVVPRQTAVAAPVAPGTPVRRLRDSSHVVGYAIVVLVGIFWAAATLWLADGRGELGPFAASALRTPAGAAGMLAFGLVTAPTQLAAPFKRRELILGIAAISVVGTLFGSLLYVYAVGEAGPGKASILNACAPLLALPLSILVLKEPLTRLVATGTIVCVAGIILVVA